VIAVVTTVRDGERALPGLADALDAQTLCAFDWVVIDNASRDRTADVARARGATVVTEPRPGRARARNRGVAATRAQLLAFTDADCRPRPDWLARLGAQLERGEPLVAGRVVVTTTATPNAIERFEKLWRFRDDPGATGRRPRTSACAARRSTRSAASTPATATSARTSTSACAPAPPAFA
jgi:glycosyltransferase involved in cell wall biosynthesis